MGAARVFVEKRHAKESLGDATSLAHKDASRRKEEGKTHEMYFKGMPKNLGTFSLLLPAPFHAAAPSSVNGIDKGNDSAFLPLPNPFSWW